MSKHGLISTIIATELAEALRKDGYLDHHDKATMRFKEHTTKWIREIAKELSKLEET